MADRQTAGVHRLADFTGQVQDAQQIRHRGPALTDPLGDLLLGQVEFLHQLPVGQGFLYRREFLALDVLHQRHFQTFRVAGFLDDDRNLLHPGPLSRAEAPFAENQLVAACHFSDYERLQYSLVADGIREFRDLPLIEKPARLARIRVDFRYGDAALGRRVEPRRIGHERVQSPPQRTFLRTGCAFAHSSPLSSGFVRVKVRPRAGV